MRPSRRSRAARIVATVCASAVVYLVWTPTYSAADHTSCRQFDSWDGNDTYYGTSDRCDEFWMRDGNDSAYGYANGPDLITEEYHMGRGADGGHGGGDRDYVYGGDSPVDVFDILKGGEGNDYLVDGDGPDAEIACGGDGEDYLDVTDTDGNDTAKGEAHPYGHQDQVLGNGGDTLEQDGSC